MARISPRQEEKFTNILQKSNILIDINLGRGLY